MTAFKNSHIGQLLRALKLISNATVLEALGQLARQRRELDAVRMTYPKSVIDDDVVLQGWAPERLRLGIGTRMEKGCVVALGDPHNGYGRLSIGAMSWIGQYNNFRLASGAEIVVGDDCLISQFCSIVGANHRTNRSALIREMPCDTERLGVIIGDDVWLGVGCTILPGVRIGRGVVVAANSVTIRSIPDYEIWAGTPAKKIGERS
jgi:acetyltransferase-like isoleucine patch superfamily enzyme